jgi:hypothetical protein
VHLHLSPPFPSILHRSAAAAAGGAAALAERRRAAAALESALAGRLDPIDWATYEPYLDANKQRAAARRQVRAGCWQPGWGRSTAAQGSVARGLALVYAVALF